VATIVLKLFTSLLSSFSPGRNEQHRLKLFEYILVKGGHVIRCIKDRIDERPTGARPYDFSSIEEFSSEGIGKLIFLRPRFGTADHRHGRPVLLFQFHPPSFQFGI